MRLCAATTWGYGSDGRAMRSQRIGHGFESRYLHQQRRLRQGRKRKEVATTAASFLLLRMLHRLLVPLSGERNNVALRCTTLTLRLRLGTNPVISTKRDVYAHSAFTSELETALSVSFSFSGIFVHVMSLILNNYT